MSACPPDGDFFRLVYDELRRLAAAKLAGEPPQSADPLWAFARAWLADSLDPG
jgi:hypothetical protein